MCGVEVASSLDVGALKVFLIDPQFIADLSAQVDWGGGGGKEEGRGGGRHNEMTFFLTGTHLQALGEMRTPL